MHLDLIILLLEAVAAYFLVVWTHSLRHRYGLAFFYALLGGITAVMSWLTDAGATVQVAGISLMVGSTVFYTSLLLGVFIIYVFDGPRATRVAIATVAGVSAMVPIIAATVHLQMNLSGNQQILALPMPSLRINAASVLTTIADLLFLAVAWEFLGKPKWKMPLWMRTFATLLGVMWLDVFLFASGAFAGAPNYLNIMAGTFISRLLISLIAFPFLYIYLAWESRKRGITIESRPVLAILREFSAMSEKLTRAEQEIARRKEVEKEKEAVIAELEAALARVRKLEGLLAVCSRCKQIRVEDGKDGKPDRWIPLDQYVRQHTEVKFTHGLCDECLKITYPDLLEQPPERDASDIR